MQKITRFLILIAVLSTMSPVVSIADIRGAPIASYPCAPGGHGVFPNTNKTTCEWYDYTNGTGLWGAGQKIGGGVITVNVGFNSSYVPVSGIYKMRLRTCPNSVASRCSIAASTQYWDSNNRVELSSKSLIVSQNPNFGGAPAGQMAQSGNLCWTFVDESNIEWTTTGASRTCIGAHTFPTAPALCSLNFGEDLDVPLGTLERRDITTSVGSSAGIKRNIAVLCARDSGITVKMTFQYMPVNVGGQQLVKTSTDGLGVAITYNGKVISPSDSILLSYGAGYSWLALGFEAVRDPNVKASEIKTGGFNASATVIMTEQ